MALVNVDEDSWLTEFANLERLSQQVQRQLADRDSQNSTSGNYLNNFLIRDKSTYD